jgi:hypothetical protein
MTNLIHLYIPLLNSVFSNFFHVQNIVYNDVEVNSEDAKKMIMHTKILISKNEHLFKLV